MSDDKECRELLDDDGENRAVRCFLGMYQCGGNPSVKQMKIHLEHSGFNDCWPDWVTDPKNAGHLTKGGAQDWLRHLFALESRAAKPAVPEGFDDLIKWLLGENGVFAGRPEGAGAYWWRKELRERYETLLSAAPPLPVAQGVPQWLSPNDPPQTDGQTCVIVEADPGEPSSVIFATWDAKSNTFDTADVGWFNPSEVMCWMAAAPLPAAPTPPAAPKEPTDD